MNPHIRVADKDLNFLDDAQLKTALANGQDVYVIVDLDPERPNWRSRRTLWYRAQEPRAIKLPENPVLAQEGK